MVAHFLKKDHELRGKKIFLSVHGLYKIIMVFLIHKVITFDLLIFKGVTAITTLKRFKVFFLVM